MYHGSLTHDEVSEVLEVREDSLSRRPPRSRNYSCQCQCSHNGARVRWSENEDNGDLIGPVRYSETGR